jgi:hypothetical protein
MLRAILDFSLDYGILNPICDPNFAGWETFYSRAVIQITIVDSPAFLEHGLAEKIAICAHTASAPNI